MKKYLLAILFLAGCSGGPELRYAVPETKPSERVSVVHRTIEVRDITLPTYASMEKIFTEDADGALVSSNMLWADEPGRGVTLALSRALADITGRTTASEPWPFDDDPDARVEVRIEEFVASRLTSEFRMSGQYFVAALEGRGRNRSGVFNLSVALPEDAGPRAIAEARSRIVVNLAELIARKGLR